MASMRLKQKWHAIIATAGAASFRMTGWSGPTVSAPGVRVVLAMARKLPGRRPGGQRAGSLLRLRRRALLSYSERSAAFKSPSSVAPSRGCTATPTLTESGGCSPPPAPPAATGPAHRHAPAAPRHGPRQPQSDDGRHPLERLQQQQRFVEQRPGEGAVPAQRPPDRDAGEQYDDRRRVALLEPERHPQQQRDAQELQRIVLVLPRP